MKQIITIECLDEGFIVKREHYVWKETACKNKYEVIDLVKVYLGF